ncbi:hypothetical protein JCM5296_001936 [Sporobolomyces johnsonii]
MSYSFPAPPTSSYTLEGRSPTPSQRIRAAEHEESGAPGFAASILFPDSEESSVDAQMHLAFDYARSSGGTSPLPQPRASLDIESEDSHAVGLPSRRLGQFSSASPPSSSAASTARPPRHDSRAPHLPAHLDLGTGSGSSWLDPSGFRSVPVSPILGFEAAPFPEELGAQATFRRQQQVISGSTEEGGLHVLGRDFLDSPPHRQRHRASSEGGGDRAERGSFREVDESPQAAARDIPLARSRDTNSPSPREGPAPVPNNLPELEPGSTAPTALANWAVDQELEYTVSKLIGEHVLDEVLKDQRAFRMFREYIVTHGGDPVALDLYNDLKVFSDLSTKLRLSSSAILSTYLLKTSPHRLQLPISIRGPVLHSLSSSSSVNLSLLAPLQELLTRVYETEFRGYVQQRLVELVVKRLGSWKVGSGWQGQMGSRQGGTDGLADCYCLLRDNPIVLASEGFAQLTGYSVESIVGRNCRFLQGPGTAPESVTRLRDALNAGERITTMILNYRRNGQPFHNLLCMLPLKSSSGEVRFFLGGQIDVTGAINSLSSLADSSASSDAGSVRNLGKSEARFTPSVQAQTDRLVRASHQYGTLSAAAAQQLAIAPLPSAYLPALPDIPTALDSAVDTGVKPQASTATLNIRRRPSMASIDSASSSSKDSKASKGRVGAGVRGAAEAIAAAATGRSKKKVSKKSELGITVEEYEAAGGADRGGRRINPLMNKLYEFEQTYSRVMLIRQSSREILFCTPELINYCGLPASAEFELVGLEFIKLLVTPLSNGLLSPSGRSHKSSSDDEGTRRLRRNVRLALEKGHAWSGAVGLRPEVKHGLFRKSEKVDVKDCVLHLTPLCTKDGTEAFVAVFG